MPNIKATTEFTAWLDGLADDKDRRRIAIRLARVEAGLIGDAEPVGEGVSELRLHFGPGYRVYFVRRGIELIWLLCGGDKSTQQRDIKRAKELAKELRGTQ